MKAAERLIREVTRWAAARPDITALALVGSWARGTPRPDSDVDFVLLTPDPEALLADRRWLSAFGEIDRVSEEDWGPIRSLRVVYRPNLEVEFGIGKPAWAETQPLGPGTERVARDGLQALHDPAGILQALQAAVDRG